MVFILSDSTDETTNFVIDWLNYFGQKFIRHNRRDKLIDVKINVEKGYCDINLGVLDGQLINEIDFKKIKTYWYRRGDFVIGVLAQKRHSKIINPILQKEWGQIKEYLHFVLNGKRSLGAYNSEYRHNKLIALHLANEVGLETPNTRITSKKDHIKLDKVITKAISDMFSFESKVTIQSIATQRVSLDNFNILGDWFFPTLIQNEVKKAFEIRIFFINEDFYPMAIFSQSDEKTQLDFRNYNKEKPNRMVPYSLPSDIQLKISQLMVKLDLNTGSIDMIVTLEGEHVFLEVNPIGQFGWLSYHCNYAIEKSIANFLTYEL